MTGRTATSTRREAILAAALTCFDELGWSATTIADIRERSGASTGSIYHHFGDKEGIAAALYAETLRSYREALGERLDRTRTAKGLVRALVLHHIEWSASRRAGPRSSSRASLSSESLAPSSIDAARGFRGSRSARTLRSR